VALPDEEVIIKNATQGDPEAFEALVTRYEKGLYNLAYRFLSNPEDAMDVVQEVFLKAFQSLPNFRGESKFSTWIYRVCVNSCLDLLRKRPRFEMCSLDEPMRLEDSYLERQVADRGDTVQEIAERMDLGEKLLSILKDLDPHYRVIVILCDIQGYSYQETADILGISIGTVKSRLHRARNLLRNLFITEQFPPSFVKQDERRDR